MSRQIRPIGRSAVRVFGWFLISAGIGSGLAGCVVPGTSTFIMRPERIAPPPLEEIAPSAPPDDGHQNNRLARSAAREEPRRELAVPDTSDLPPPQARE